MDRAFLKKAWERRVGRPKSLPDFVARLQARGLKAVDVQVGVYLHTACHRPILWPIGPGLVIYPQPLCVFSYRIWLAAGSGRRLPVGNGAPMKLWETEPFLSKEARSMSYALIRSGTIHRLNTSHGTIATGYMYDFDPAPLQAQEVERQVVRKALAAAAALAGLGCQTTINGRPAADGESACFAIT